MRAEDKELEGPELEREVGLEQEGAKQEEEELPMIAGEQVVDLELAHRGRLFDAIQLILGKQNVNVSLLYLPQREAQALEFLQTAVTGRDSMYEFVFAEDRKVLLEQALAVLQANLTHGDQAQLSELHAKFDQLSTRVGELRAELVNLEDAQEDLFDEKKQTLEETTDEGDDEGDGDQPPAEPEAITDFIAAALNAMAEVTPSSVPAIPASLSGPEAPDPAPAVTTLVGPELPAAPAHATTLVGPEVPAGAPAPSTLDGPEVVREPAPSTLAEQPPARAVKRSKPRG
ncbi:MAG: hypothetical protein WKG01_12140 [Kofleriaceae bacterium]